MKCPRLAVMAAFVILGIVSERSAAQVKPQVQITAARAGFLAGPLAGNDDVARRSPMFKAGHWTPVLVTLEGKGKIDGAELVVQVSDCDDVNNDYAVRLPQIEFSAEAPSYPVLTYARPGRNDSTVTVSVRRNGANLCPSFELNPFALEPTMYFYVTLGARLPGLQPPGLSNKENRRSEVAAADSAGQLPDKWFGYQSADVAILTTGDEKFVDGLLSDDLRRKALVEWVLRGGKLVISVGKNQALVAGLLTRHKLDGLLPAQLVGTSTPKSIRVNGLKVNSDLVDPQSKDLIDLTKLELKPGRGARVRVSQRLGAENVPLVVQAPYGLGRVTLVAFDLDRPPFTRWKEQGVFWENLLRESGPLVADNPTPNPNAGFSTFGAEDPELLRKMQNGVEAFDGVPVISFGWVALFILIYIIVVGPLDYYFLKKVVKRLELTWVTFPLVVLLVSAGAYFAAYALKGDDQKINKIDLIDIDLQTETVQGRTWFSIFSPRIQNFTIGIEPVEAWGIRRETSPGTVVSWFGSTNNSRKTLFRRSYDYETNAGGLVRVPIQVWSLKDFEACWLAPIDTARPPFRSELLNAPENKLAGSVVSHLPVALEEAFVFHKGNVYALGTLMPGESNRKNITAPDTSGVDSWFSGRSALMTMARPGSAEPARGFMREVMFYDRAQRLQPQATGQNAGLRELDQSWRLESQDDPGDFAVLVGKLALASGEAEVVAQKPSTAALLWLGALPDGKVRRDSSTLKGNMRQETYVRLFLPVKSRK